MQVTGPSGSGTAHTCVVLWLKTLNADVLNATALLQVTGLSGNGPAYVFMVIKALAGCCWLTLLSPPDPPHSLPCGRSLAFLATVIKALAGCCWLTLLLPFEPPPLTAL